MEAPSGGVLQAPLPHDLIRVSVLPHPLRLERREQTVVAGATYEQIRALAGLPEPFGAFILDGGAPVPPDLWAAGKPAAGSHVVIRAVPRGNVVNMVKAWVEYVAAWVTLPYTLYRGKYESLWFGSLFQAPEINTDGLYRGYKKGRATLEGARNEMDPYGVTPTIMGKRRIFPKMAARPYTETSGKKQYLNLLFYIAANEVEMSDLRIGNTPIRGGVKETDGKHDSDVFKETQYEVRLGKASDLGMTLFPSNVREEQMTVRLQNDLGKDPGTDELWSRRDTEPDSEAFEIQYEFPSGLYKITDDGKGKLKVKLQFRYRKAGTSTWTNLPDREVEEKDNEPVLDSLRVPTDGSKLTAAKYEVEVRRFTQDRNGLGKVDRVYWTALRSIRFVNPVPNKKPALVAMRIRATNQLNGVIDQFNCVVQSVVEVYEGGNWNTKKATSNVAALYRHVLKSSENPKALADSRIDLAELQAWYAEGYEFNDYWDDEADVWERLRVLADSGRASPNFKDGKFSVVRDRATTTIVQHFTPANSRDFLGNRVYPDIPHGLIVEYPEPTKDYEVAEVVVYDTGFDKSTATLFERLRLTGVTDVAEAKKLAKRNLAIRRLRPETYEINVDVENLICNRGDLVRVTHDVPLIGTGFGRVKSLLTSGTDVTGVVFDTVVVFDGVSSYGIRIRKSDGVSIAKAVNSAYSGDATFINFVTPIPISEPQPAVGDLFLFGIVSTESAEMVVAEISHGPDLSARLVLVDYNTGIYSAETGAIPAYQPNVTRRKPYTDVTPNQSQSGLAGSGNAASNAANQFGSGSGGSVTGTPMTSTQMGAAKKNVVKVGGSKKGSGGKVKPVLRISLVKKPQSLGA